jgi:hypothetical protein
MKRQNKLSEDELFFCNLAILLKKSITEIFELPYKELLIWKKYKAEFGIAFTHLKDDYLNALLCKVIANVNGNSNVKLQDFLFFYALDDDEKKNRMNENKDSIEVLKAKCMQLKRRIDKHRNKQNKTTVSKRIK